MKPLLRLLPTALAGSPAKSSLFSTATICAPSQAISPAAGRDFPLSGRTVETAFDKKFREMSDGERLQTESDYAPLNARDWRQLTLDEKRAIYTVAYGPPKIVDPHEGKKVLAGVVLVVSTACTFYYLLRQRANPPPATVSPEHREKTEAFMRKNTINPISGYSAKDED